MAAIDLPDGLLNAVRNYLDITWVDCAGDVKLTGIIERGMKYIDAAAGEALDYTVEDKPRELLFDYCRYVRSNALDEFQVNYLPELLGLQSAYDVARAMTEASLLSLTVGSLDIDFNPATRNYTATTTNNSDIVTAVAKSWDAGVLIRLNGVPMLNGTAATWATGRNGLVVSVTCGGVTVCYTVVVTR